MDGGVFLLSFLTGLGAPIVGLIAVIVIFTVIALALPYH